MKKIIIIPLLLSFLASGVFGQLKFSSVNFPIGGFDISTLWPPTTQLIVDSMFKIGFNTYYQADYNGRLDLSLLMNQDYGMKMYMSAVYFPNQNQPNQMAQLLDKYFVGDRFNNTPGTERRYFLATTADQRGTSSYAIKSDYERTDLKASQAHQASAWTATPQGAPPLASPNEWEIPITGTNNPLLTLELDSRHISPSPGYPDEDGSLAGFHDGGNTNLVSDFIFRFDQSAAGSTGTLYTVNVYVDHDPSTDPADFTLLLTEALYTSNNSFAMHSFPNKDPNNPTTIDYNNPLSLFNFPNIQNVNDPTYAVARVGSFDIGQRDSPGMKHKVVFTLTRSDAATNANIPIYVRGFRLRTQRADDILANNLAAVPWGNFSLHMNDQIDQFFAQLYIALTGTGVNKNNISNITGCGELLRDGYRTLAYIDHRFQNYSKKNLGGQRNILAFLAQNVYPAYSEYRSIYEDEIGTPPPVIDAEGTFSSYANFSPPPSVPRDEILNSIQTTSGFTDFGFPLVPSTGSTDLSGGYTSYTNMWHGITGTHGESVFEEGCLSLPEIREEIVRPESIGIKFLNEDFKEVEMEADKLLARVMQHEVDHLHGKYFIDYLSPLKLSFLKGKLNKLRKGEVETEYPLAPPSGMKKKRKK